MPAFATTDDVAARWHSLTAAQSSAASVLLDEASALLRQLVGAELDDRVAADPDLAVITRGVTAAMVLRVLRNPDGKTAESIEDYSYRRSDATSDGSLYVSDDELSRLLSRSVPMTGAYVVSLSGYELL